MLIESYQLMDLGYKSYLEHDLILRGWVKFNRKTKQLGFIELNDGTHCNNIQIVYDDRLANFNEIATLLTGSSIEIYGRLVETPNSPQAFEIKAGQIKIYSKTDEAYPLQKKRHTFEYLREQAYLRGRTNTFSVIFRLRSYLAQEIHNFFQKERFLYLTAPIITGSDAEGAGEMFRVVTSDEEKEFFGKTAHLSVSGQLNAEAFALAYKKVYTFGPTFRAENSNTTRHAAEFWMIEPEVAFNHLEDNVLLAERLLKHLVSKVLECCKDEIAFCERFIEKGLIEKLETFMTNDIAKITYTEAIEQLKPFNHLFEHEVAWGIDLKTEHERYLTEDIYKGAVFVTDYPKEIKAFYMKQNDDGKTVAAMDLLVPGIGELIGGSEREDRVDCLKNAMKYFGLDENEYEWYINLRRYGSVPHAGFGIGFERLIMFITGMDNIRDVIPFPRVPGQIKF